MPKEPASNVNKLASARRLALRAGELHGEAVRQMLATYEKAKGNPFRAMRHGLKKLVAMKVIREKDSVRLTRMARALYAERSARLIHAAFASVFDELISDQRSSPASLAIAAIAVDSIRSVIDQPISIARSVAQADAVGAAAGAGAAANEGGAQDIVLGAVAGGAASSGYQFIRNKK